MSISLRFLSGQSLGLLLLLLVSTLTLSNCTKLPLGGTNVAANTQLGKQNNQTIGTSTVTEQTFRDSQINKVASGDNKVSADLVETVVVNEYPIWLIIAFVVAVLMDSPIRIFQELIYGRKRL